jgi:putative hydrolase of the HAD superfamily
MIDAIAFDADDTLWHNETLFTMTQEHFRELIAPFLSGPYDEQALYETELRNLKHFGYGVKGFTLSMIETAIELTDGRISGREIHTLIDFARAQIGAPTELLPGVAEVVVQLSRTHRLLVITKGDLFEQESKLARSGLGAHFAHIEIVSDKTPEVYAAILRRNAIAPERFLMVGNSLKSDILPVLAAGGRAAYIPYHTTWAHELVPEDMLRGKEFFQLESVAELPDLVATL